jgi:hypothetical protein
VKLKIVVTPEERTMIVAALAYFGQMQFAREFNDRIQDLADDGPEIAILSVESQQGGF